MLIGARMAAWKLPYDAEIEYLAGSSTGSDILSDGPMIELDYLDSSNFRIDAKIRTPNSFSKENDLISNQDDETGRFVVGTYSNLGIFQYCKSSVYNPGNTNIQIDSNTDAVISAVYSKTAKTLTVNGLQSTRNYSQTPIENTNVKIRLFCGWNKNLERNWYHYDGRIYWIKLTKDDVLWFDFIPVRVGSVGYMYDRVSKQLFANAGTGAFIIGPDKT